MSPNTVNTKRLLQQKVHWPETKTLSGRQQFGTGNAGVDGRLTLTSNDGSATSLLIMDSRKQADSCLIYLRHAGGNKFSIGLNGDSDLEIYNRATDVVQITFPIGGGVNLADGAVGVTQSADDDSTSLATTAYCDNQVSSAGGGGTTYTVLSQKTNSSATTFRGYYQGGSTYTLRSLSTTETDIIIWDESNSSYDGCLELPKLSTVDVGHTVNVYAWGNNIASVTFQHADDIAAGNKMCNAYAWSGAYTTANGIRAHSNVSYRFIKFVKIQRTIIKNGAYSFWLVMLFDTLNA